MLLFAIVCCYFLQYVVIFYGMLVFSIVCCYFLQYIVIFYSMLLFSIECCYFLQYVVICYSMLLFSKVCCYFLQCVVIFYSILLFSIVFCYCLQYVVIFYSMLLFSILCCQKTSTSFKLHLQLNHMGRVFLLSSENLKITKLYIKNTITTNQQWIHHPTSYLEQAITMITCLVYLCLQKKRGINGTLRLVK